MASSQLGARRICAACERPFYDLNRSPGACPKCGTEVVVAPARSPRARRPKLAPPPKPPPPEVEAEGDAGVALLEVDEDDESPAKEDEGE